MKPLKLEMSAFGSYAGKTEVDFTTVNHGIFLITGDTGAGKTTIYDAITYALYDKSSGNQRDGNMMRSQYAALDMPTYVKFTFEYTGKEYTILRNPEYERESKRKKSDGSSISTKETAKVSLILPDGLEFIGKKAETNKKIVEIIGLDANQFSQVAMIAQGDFVKLLHADSNERKIIFSKIFNTKIYYTIQEELKNRFKSVFGQLEDNKKECHIIMDGIAVSEDSEFLEGFDECRNCIEPDFEKFMPLLKSMEKELKQKQQEIKNAEKAVQQSLDEINAKIKTATETNELFVQLEKAKNRQVELEAQKISIHEMKILVERAKKAEKVAIAEDKYFSSARAYKLAEAQIAELASWIEKNQGKVNEKQAIVELLKNQKALEESQLQQIIARVDSAIYSDFTSIKETSGSWNSADKNENWEVKTVAELEAEYRDCKLDFAKMEAELKELTERQEMLHSLSENIVKLEKLEIVQKREYDMLEKAILCYRSQNEIYEKSYDAFLSEQAGILAKDLKEGMPCPVCGATSHPAKTRLSESAVTQEAVNAAKKARDQQEIIRDKANDTFLNSKSEYEKERDYIEREARKVITEEFVADEAGFRLIVEKLKESGRKLGIFQLEIENARQTAKKYRNEAAYRLQYLTVSFEKESRELQSLVNELKTKSGALDNEKTNCKKREKESIELKNTYQELISSNGFADENEYKGSKKSDAELEIYATKIEAFKEDEIRTNQNIQILSEQTSGKIIIDVEALAEQQTIVTAEKTKIENSHRILFSQMQQITQAKEKLERLSQKREKLKKEYETISALSKTANGNLSGSAKIDFETYVLRQYFRQIIAAANRRLLKMVSDQFKLQCRDIDNLGGQGASGLDLDVFSLVTNSSRDVKTLSGGESFMAALSMALGLADVIQNAAGSVHLETMFIDEGFGSLDDESREQAIMILNELAGEKRLVGIISHVTELKEQIDRKLIVEKSEKGSRIRWSFS